MCVRVCAHEWSLAPSVDWYATFAVLAGQSPRDDPPQPPLPVDPANPQKDIYGNNSYPGEMEGGTRYPAAHPVG